MVYSTGRFVLCLTLCQFVLCFSVLLALRLPRLGRRELILVLFVRLFDLCLFGFVGFLFLLVSGKGCGLWLWHSLDFSLTFFIQFVSNSPEFTFFHTFFKGRWYTYKGQFCQIFVSFLKRGCSKREKLLLFNKYKNRAIKPKIGNGIKIIMHICIVCTIYKRSLFPALKYQWMNGQRWLWSDYVYFVVRIWHVGTFFIRTAKWHSIIGKDSNFVDVFDV